MLTALLISQVVLFACLGVVCVAVLALARQIGVLHERLAPLGETDAPAGLDTGRAVPRITMHTLDGAPVPIGERLAEGRRQLLLFVAADCPLCKRVLPVALDMHETGTADLVVVGDGAPPELAVLAQSTIRDRAPLVTGSELALVLQVARMPFAAVIDEAGILLARGLVASRTDLEKLVANAI